MSASTTLAAPTGLEPFLQHARALPAYAQPLARALGEDDDTAYIVCPAKPNFFLHINNLGIR